MPKNEKPDNQGKGRRLPPIETRWKPGQSGNPNGRPRRKLPSETMAEMASAVYDLEMVKELQKRMPEPWRSKGKLTVQEVHCWVTLQAGLRANGDRARQEFYDRIEGKPVQKIVGPTGGPVEITTEDYDWSKLSEDKLRILRDVLSEAMTSSNGDGK